jgi:hypothetical protein
VKPARFKALKSENEEIFHDHPSEQQPGWAADPIGRRVGAISGHRKPLDRRHPRQRTSREDSPTRRLLVSFQHPDPERGRGLHGHRAGTDGVVDNCVGLAGQRLRDAVHGAARVARSAARTSPDDPVSSSVRLSRRGAALVLGALHLHNLRRCGHRHRLPGPQFHLWLEHLPGWHRHCVGGGFTRGLRLRLAAPRLPGALLGPFFIVFSATASNNISYAPVVSDYSRYLPRWTPLRKIFAAVFAGAFLSLSWMAAIGAWLAAHVGATDALSSVRDAGNHITSGFGTVLIIVAIIALVATMGEMAYSGQLVILTAIDSIRPIKSSVTKRAVAATGIAIVWAFFGLVVFHNVTTAVYDGLILSLYLLTPWTIVNLYDYFFVRKGKYAITELENRNGIYGLWGWRGISAYLIGFAASIPFWDLSFYVSPVAKAANGLDVSFIVELVVSGVLFALFSRSHDSQVYDEAVRASNLELEALGIRNPLSAVTPSEAAVESSV